MFPLKGRGPPFCFRPEAEALCFVSAPLQPVRAAFYDWMAEAGLRAPAASDPNAGADSDERSWRIARATDGSGFLEAAGGVRLPFVASPARPELVPSIYFVEIPNQMRKLREIMKELPPPHTHTHLPTHAHTHTRTAAARWAPLRARLRMPVRFPSARFRFTAIDLHASGAPLGSAAHADVVDIAGPGAGRAAHPADREPRHGQEQARGQAAAGIGRGRYSPCPRRMMRAGPCRDYQCPYRDCACP